MKLKVLCLSVLLCYCQLSVVSLVVVVDVVAVIVIVIAASFN